MEAALHLADRIRVEPTTRHRDYVLTDYAPCVDPAGRLQPVSLLRAALRDADLLRAFEPIHDALRAGLGPDETVWGIKFDASGFVSVELYFYGAPRTPAGGDRSASAVAALLGEVGLDIPGGVDEALPYFLCSLDLDRDALRGGRTDGFRVYVHSHERDRKPVGVSYRVDGAGHHLENHYWFYDGRTDVDDARRRLLGSPHAGSRAAHAALLRDSLLPCHTVCFATKPRADGLYFSRITSGRLRSFLADRALRTHAATAHVAALLRAHERDFAHARWDLGFDFTAPSPSAASAPVRKLAVHGIF